MRKLSYNLFSSFLLVLLPAATSCQPRDSFCDVPLGVNLASGSDLVSAPFVDVPLHVVVLILVAPVTNVIVVVAAAILA
jgi:hypothetical protein